MSDDLKDRFHPTHIGFTAAHLSYQLQYELTINQWHYLFSIDSEFETWQLIVNKEQKRRYHRTTTMQVFFDEWKREPDPTLTHRADYLAFFAHVKAQYRKWRVNNLVAAI